MDSTGPAALTQSLLAVLLLVAALAALPWAIRLIRQRLPGGVSSGVEAEIQVRGMAALGPQQRVVSIEAGPPGQRRHLILGVSPGGIVCLSQWTQGKSSSVSDSTNEPKGTAGHA